MFDVKDNYETSRNSIQYDPVNKPYEGTVTYLQADDVFKFVEGKGTKIATVTFIKADGSERVCNGLFKPSIHIVGSDRGYKQGQDMRAKGIIPMYDLQKKAWICFYVTKVTNIR